MRIAEHLSASVAGPREMRVRIRHGHIHPALSEMATVQLIRKIRLNQHAAAPVPERGVPHGARVVATDLVSLQAERLGQEGERSLDIEIGE
jgi:hypothetical protein